MDKDSGSGHYSLHRVPLSPFKGHITGMGGGRHRLFQGILQVHLPDCLLPAGCGDTVLHPQLPGLLTIPAMKRIYHTDSCKTLQGGAVLTGGSFCVRDLAEMGKMSATGMAVRENGDADTAIDRPENYRAKLANASFGRQGRAFQVSGKIILTAFRYFSRKPCLTGSVRRKALVVQRAAKALVSQFK